MLQQPAHRERLRFASPVSTSQSELLGLRTSAHALQRRLRKKSAAPSSGGSVSKRLGRGLDFAEVRQYQPGDDVRMIDWKVTARSGSAHTKLFIEERERPVLLVVDCRASMRFGTQGMYKSAMAARLSALLGWCAVAGRDRLGGFVFSDNWHDEVRPKSGRGGLMQVFRSIQQAEQDFSTAGGNQLQSTLERLQHGVHAGSTVILLSDFQGFDETARRSLGGALRQLDVLAVHICDAMDVSLPGPGRYPMFSPSERGPQRLLMTVSDKAEQLRYHTNFRTRQQTLRDLFTRHGHYYTTVMTHWSLRDSAAQIVARNVMRTDEVFKPHE